MTAKGKPFVTWGKAAFIGLFMLSMILVNQAGAEAEKYNMSYLYFNEGSFVHLVDQAQGSLQTVAPSYFNIDSNGNLDLKVDTEFVKQMHEREIRVVPFLSNHWSREDGRKALANPDFVNQLVAAIKTYNLDGVNVDLENLTEADRDAYTAFMKKLSEQMPEGKEVSIAVAANPSGSERGWQGSYDYEQLAKYSDYLMLMTYDESYFGSAPGPVASISFVEQSIKYALSKAPPEKIVLGIPFYGRYWREGDARGGYGVPAKEVDELVALYGGRVYMDIESQSPYAKITIKASDPVSKVHGRVLRPGQYTMWYENAESIKMKLKLVSKYNLRGTGSWSLTETSAETWDYYAEWLNGEHYFLDAEDHWAEQDIMEMLKRQWMVGITDSLFAPNQPLTRAQAMTILVRALGADGTNTGITVTGGVIATAGEGTVTTASASTVKGAVTTASATVFTDVSASYWAADAIATGSRLGWIKGVGNGKFAPEQPVSREQMAVILARVFDSGADMVASGVGLGTDTQQASEVLSPYVDVKTSYWAYKEIISMTERNIFQGDQGKFYPKQPLTRAQMAALMNRILAI